VIGPPAPATVDATTVATATRGMDAPLPKFSIASKRTSMSLQATRYFFDPAKAESSIVVFGDSCRSSAIQPSGS
jgi:hypothetical protein